MKVAIGAVRGRRTKSFTEISKQQIYFSIQDSTPDYHTLDSLEKVQKMTVRSYVTAEFIGTESYAAPEYLAILIDSMQQHEIF